METKKYNPDIHNRHSIRMKGYDYSKAGLYFITICTKNRLHLFGHIAVGAGSKPATMILNEYGQIIKNTWFDLKNHVSNIKLHEFIIMPNHVHGIIEIILSDLKPANMENNMDICKPVKHDDSNGAGLEPAPLGKSIMEIVRQFKTFSAKRINQLRNTPGVPVWQRNYYEHIIRNEQSYLNISWYITNNPINWMVDKYYK